MLPLADWFKLNVLPIFGFWLIKFLGWTNKISFVHQDIPQGLRQKNQGMIFAIWHGQQLLMPLAFTQNPACALVSQHHDGEIIFRIIRSFGHRAVRGSTTRGGGLAFRRLIRIGRSGGDIVVTPDGPKGPREVVKPGIVHLAKMTGLPIIPLVCVCSKKKSSPVGIDSYFRYPLGQFDLYGGSLLSWNQALMRTV